MDFTIILEYTQKHKINCEEKKYSHVNIALSVPYNNKILS